MKINWFINVFKRLLVKLSRNLTWLDVLYNYMWLYYTKVKEIFERLLFD